MIVIGAAEDGCGAELRQFVQNVERGSVEI